MHRREHGNSAVDAFFAWCKAQCRCLVLSHSNPFPLALVYAVEQKLGQRTLVEGRVPCDRVGHKAIWVRTRSETVAFDGKGCAHLALSSGSDKEMVMATLKEEISALLAQSPGLTDREITNRLRGSSVRQQPTNTACRELVKARVLERHKRDDGLIGNYPRGTAIATDPERRKTGLSRTGSPSRRRTAELSEDEVKEALVCWLARNGWKSKVAWGKQQGIDIEATRGGERWIIEVKGCGSRSAMRVNYFLAVLGETMQRMDDPHARYSIALPDMRQYRGLWDRLPTLAKTRMGITGLFIEDAKTVHHRVT